MSSRDAVFGEKVNQNSFCNQVPVNNNNAATSLMSPSLQLALLAMNNFQNTPLPQAPVDIEATKNILGICTDGTPKTNGNNCNSQDPSTNSSNSPSSNN